MRLLRGAALNLAVFRIAVGGLILWLPDFHQAPRYAGLPREVLTAPVGLDQLLISPTLTTLLYQVALLAVIAGMMGFLSRIAWSVASAALLYVLAVPQFVGSAAHYHHLLWFAVLLAVSPASDTLSVDAWLAHRRSESLDRGPSTCYGAPLQAAWVLLGLVFFFPGLHKLLTGGIEWVWSDNLRNQLYAKWTQRAGFEPLFRIDHYPTLLRLGALSVVLLELSFGVLVLYRRTRLFAVGAAFLFHQLTVYFMDLHFEALWVTYVAFIDWSKIRKTKRAPPAVDRAPSRLFFVAAAVLIVGNFAFGAAGISDGWPFACYPKFDRPLETTTLPALEVELTYRDRPSHIVPVEDMNATGAAPRWWALTWSLLGAHERARADPARFRSFWSQIVRRDAVRASAVGAESVRFNRTSISTLPEERGRVLTRRLVYEMPLDLENRDDPGS